jgi:hypothetical protein
MAAGFSSDNLICMCPTYFNDFPETYPSPAHVDQPVSAGSDMPAALTDGLAAEATLSADLATQPDPIQTISFDGWL